MIKIDITETSFINAISSDEGNQWMEDNIGEMLVDDETHNYTVGKGWKVYVSDDDWQWYAEFENDSHATLFLLMWS